MDDKRDKSGRNKSEENYDLLIRLDQKVESMDEHLKEINDTIKSRLQDKEEVSRMFARYDSQFKDQANVNKEVLDKMSNMKDDLTGLIATAKAKVEQIQLWGTIISLLLGGFAIYQIIANNSHG